MEVMNKHTKDLIKIYGSNCWMGYRVSKENPYTFHHIRKKINGGKREVENGALLTRKAHDDLNLIETWDKSYYRELNLLFKELNKTGVPPTSEYYFEIRRILEKISKKLDLSNYYIPGDIIEIKYPKNYKEDTPILVARPKRFCLLDEVDDDYDASPIEGTRIKIYKKFK